MTDRVVTRQNTRLVWCIRARDKTRLEGWVTHIYPPHPGDNGWAISFGDGAHIFRARFTTTDQAKEVIRALKRRGFSDFSLRRVRVNRTVYAKPRRKVPQA